MVLKEMVVLAPRVSYPMLPRRPMLSEVYLVQEEVLVAVVEQVQRLSPGGQHSGFFGDTQGSSIWKHQPMLSNCEPERGAPPHIQAPTMVLADRGTGCEGTGVLRVHGSSRGGKGLRKWNNVRRLISSGPECSTKSPDLSSMDIRPIVRLRIRRY